MRLPRIVFSFLIFIITFSSCTKDRIEYATGADEITKELLQTIETQSIKRVYPVQSSEPFPSSFSAAGGTAWTFSNGFISINFRFNESYNLSSLKYYEVTSVLLDDGSSATALILFF